MRGGHTLPPPILTKCCGELFLVVICHKQALTFLMDYGLLMSLLMG